MWLGLFLFSLATSSVIVAWGCIWTRRLMPEDQREHFWRWLLDWSLKGLLLPLVLWVIMNIGVSFSLQPFMPQIQAARNGGGSWAPVYMRVMAAGLFIVSSYWSVATLGWALLIVRQDLDVERRRRFTGLCIGCFALMLIPALGLVWLGGSGMLGLAAFSILALIARQGDSIVHAKKFPMYSRAIARMKFGKYAEAEWEIIRELEKCEDDFDGWMMMAELYATHFHNLGEAQKTIAEICEHPKTAAPQFSIALNRLADWHLKFGHDPEGARRALQVICDRLPGTHLAKMAELRIRQLPNSAEELREQSSVSPIPLPALGDAMDAEPPQPHSKYELAKAAELANSCVERLNLNPDDVASRERLARLMTMRLDQADLGVEQLTLLLEMPDQPDAKRAEWLSLIAAWQIKYLQDSETGRRTLVQLTRDFPQTPQALAARRRIQLMEQELGSKS